MAEVKKSDSDNEQHRKMAAQLRKALSSISPLRGCQELCTEWEQIHAKHDADVKQLTQAIRRAESHFRYDEAERLQALLDAI